MFLEILPMNAIIDKIFVMDKKNIQGSAMISA